jgi:hypothetical protein
MTIVSFRGGPETLHCNLKIFSKSKKPYFYLKKSISPSMSPDRTIARATRAWNSRAGAKINRSFKMLRKLSITAKFTTE